MAEPPENVIEVRDLAVAYGERTVLRDVELTAARGDIAVILGNSGCGKSTLLKAALGLVHPRAGSVRMFGIETTTLEPRARDQVLRRIGVMFQYGALLNSLTVGENIALPLEMHASLPTALTQEIVRTRLALVGLAGAEDLLPEELSGGMRKRAALARAMALDPEILFCDEPGAGLDPVTAAGIDELLLTLNRSLGTTLIIVTHELLSIHRLNGQLTMLDQGERVFYGSVAAAMEADNPTVQRFFNPGS